MNPRKKKKPYASRSTRTFASILFAIEFLVGCGGKSADPKVDPGEVPSSPIQYSSKPLAGRSTLLKRALEVNVPSGEPDRAFRLQFFESLAPAITETLLEIEAERSFILGYVPDRDEKSNSSNESDTPFAILLKRYRAKNAEELRVKVDAIPIDMLLAQAAVESDWGRSPVAHDCLNLFGIHAATAAQRCSGHTILANYPSLKDSVSKYVLLLNSGSAYEALRSERKNQRAKYGENGKLDSSTLVEGLLPYSTRGESYVRQIAGSIREHGLDRAYLDYSTSASQQAKP